MKKTNISFNRSYMKKHCCETIKNLSLPFDTFFFPSKTQQVREFNVTCVAHAVILLWQENLCSALV